MLAFPSVADAIVGAVLCFAIRLVSLQEGWQLPVARLAGARPPGDTIGPDDTGRP
jgi:hypothetical protein